MTDGLGLDIYVEMTSPRMRVTVVEGPDDRLEVRIGALHTSVTGESSTVHLWFRRPHAVLELGRELLAKGQMFLDQNPDRAVQQGPDRPVLAGGADGG
ncbi:hypothetical protein [Actinophytocola sp. KF-1]